MSNPQPRNVPPEEPVRFDNDDLLHVLIGVLLPLTVYALCCSRHVREWDAAEFALSQQFLGLSHPAGAELYALCGHLYFVIARKLTPFSAEYLINLFSALSMALACGFFYLTQALFTARRRLALLVTLTCAFSALPWSQAIFSEVYAFFMLCLSAFLFCWLYWLRTGSPRVLWAAAFVFALSLGAHILTCVLLPGILLTGLIHYRRIGRPGEVLPALLFLLLGLSWIFYAWIRGQSAPMIGVDLRPDSLQSLWHFLRGEQFLELYHAQYRQYWRQLLTQRLLLTPAEWIAGTLGVGLYLALRGALAGLRRAPAYLILALTFSGTIFILVAPNEMADYSELIMLAFVFMPVLMLFGVEAGLERKLRQGHQIQVAHQRAGLLLLALTAAELALFPAVTWLNQRLYPEIEPKAGLQNRHRLILRRISLGLENLQVYFPDGELPLRNVEAIRSKLNETPGPQALAGNWEVQALLTYQQFARGWFPETWFLEWINQRRFYPYGAPGDLKINSLAQIVDQVGAELALFLLIRDEPPATIQQLYDFGPRVIEPLAEYLFSRRRYYLYRVHPRLPPPVPLEQLAPPQNPGQGELLPEQSHR